MQAIYNLISIRKFMNKFFENNTFVIDEKIQALKFANEYKVYDAEGNALGAIQEVMSTSRKIGSLFMSKKNLPMNLEIRDAQGNVVASLSRGWTFLLPTLTLSDEKGAPVAKIKTKFGLKVKFDVLDLSGNIIAKIQGNWTAWDFVISDASGNQIGSISKKFNGLAKEIFTDADKYVISIEPSVTDPTLRMAMASAASIVDVVYKENR